jgi:hypothetical protein
MFSLKMNTIGQFASILLQAAINKTFGILETAFTFMLTLLMTGESPDF